MPKYAAFVQRLGWGDRHSVGYTRARYLGHVHGFTPADARNTARRTYGVAIRSCDRLVVKRDGGRRQWYGVRGAGSPGGVGLL